MGSLTPGATYVYESSADGKTMYAREEGSKKRKLIGKMIDQAELKQALHDGQMWWEIRQMADTHPALQRALENVILIYKIAKDSDDE